MDTNVFEDATELAAGAADFLADALEATPGDRVNFGLAGGSTPKATYAELATRSVAWERVDGWLPDERWVGPDHPDSNAAMAAASLFDTVEATLHPVPWNPEGGPVAAAAVYEDLLGEILRREEGILRPDVVLLGMGDDGHTASLFPGTSALSAPPGSAYIANWVGDKRLWRLTATLSLLRAARQLVLLVSGASKAPMIRRVLGERERLPVLRATEGRAAVTWLLDQQAASLLD